MNKRKLCFALISTLLLSGCGKAKDAENIEILVKKGDSITAEQFAADMQNLKTNVFENSSLVKLLDDEKLHTKDIVSRDYYRLKNGYTSTFTNGKVVEYESYDYHDSKIESDAENHVLNIDSVSNGYTEQYGSKVSGSSHKLFHYMPIDINESMEYDELGMFAQQVNKKFEELVNEEHSYEAASNVYNHILNNVEGFTTSLDVYADHYNFYKNGNVYTIELAAKMQEYSQDMYSGDYVSGDCEWLWQFEVTDTKIAYAEYNRDNLVVDYGTYKEEERYDCKTLLSIEIVESDLTVTDVEHYAM